MVWPIAILLATCSFASTGDTYRINIERTKKGGAAEKAEFIVKSGERAELAQDKKYLSINLDPDELEIPGVMVDLAEGSIDSGKKNQIHSGAYVVIPGEPLTITERDETSGEESTLIIKAEEI